MIFCEKYYVKHWTNGHPQLFKLILLFCRHVHEAYQYMVQRKKKMSGRTMQENWNIGRRKSVGVALLSVAKKVK